MQFSAMGAMSKFKLNSLKDILAITVAGGRYTTYYR